MKWSDVDTEKHDVIFAPTFRVFHNAASQSKPNKIT